MSLRQRQFRVVLYLLWGILMTAMTFVLGGLPLKSLRRGAGRAVYWSACLLSVATLAAFQLYLIAAVFSSLVVLIGLFSEFEEFDLGFVPSAFFALLITAMASAGGIAFWIYSAGPSWYSSVAGVLQSTLDPLMKANAAFKVNIDEVIMQLPSLAVIMWMVTLYLAVLMEARLTAPSEVELPPSRFRSELPRIRVPDVVVWVFIGALLGAFGGFEFIKAKGIQPVFVNIFNICLVAFFFQGLAVVSQFFVKLKMAWFWQALLMVVIVLQLFVFVAFLGLADHWLDFRLRMEKSRDQKELKREI